MAAVIIALLLYPLSLKLMGFVVKNVKEEIF